MNKIENKVIGMVGGGGFISSHIIDILLKKNPKEIRVFDNFSRSNDNLEHLKNEKRINFINGDIRSVDDIGALLRGGDYCFQMAALRVTRCAEDPRLAHEIMLDGHFNVLESCVKNKVKKLIFASSFIVYGDADEFPTSENHHPFNNRTFYGAAKTSGELMCRSFKEMFDLDFVGLRFINIYGKRMDISSKHTEVLIRWIKMINEGVRPKIFGDGNQTTDYSDVRDVARACVVALESDVTDEFFNIGTGVETSLKQLAEMLLSVYKSDLGIDYIPLPEDRKKVEILRRVPDVSKAKKMLNYSASINLEQGLEDLVSWVKTEIG